jgi:hypothetical protein
MILQLKVSWGPHAPADSSGMQESHLDHRINHNDRDQSALLGKIEL